MTIPARPIPATDVARAAQDAGFVGWQVVRMVQIAYAACRCSRSRRE